MARYRYVDLSGYGYSGKSAVIDLLREFQGYHVPLTAFEFCLLRIQGGILDLEDALCNDWSPIRSDAAIRRFKRLIIRLGTKARLADPRTWFAGAGCNYDEYFNHRFFALSEQYVNRLVISSWVTDWPYPKADLTGIELFLRRLAKKLGFSRAYDFRVYLTFPADFVEATRWYLNTVLSANVAEGTRVIVMHNAFEPFQPQRAFKYFEHVKCIIVDRDPRDSYVQQRTFRPLAVGVEDFIQRYRIQREATGKFLQPDPRILIIRFEDLVLHYDRTVARILEHLEENPSIHVHLKQYFDPEHSRRNVGIWRHYERQGEIGLIHKELREYCIDEDIVARR